MLLEPRGERLFWLIPLSLSLRLLIFCFTDDLKKTCLSEEEEEDEAADEVEDLTEVVAEDLTGVVEAEVEDSEEAEEVDSDGVEAEEVDSDNKTTVLLNMLSVRNEAQTRWCGEKMSQKFTQRTVWLKEQYVV